MLRKKWKQILHLDDLAQNNNIQIVPSSSQMSLLVIYPGFL